MTTTLVVLAHPDPRSFNAAWAQASVDACKALGDTVLVSDLVAMGFDAVERAAHYPAHPEDRPFDPLKAQETAAAQDAMPADVAAEIGKLRQADRVIFHFPIWWFAPPAVLKGWFDRVLAHGATHDVDNRFDRGQFRGRRALFCVTTGSRAEESAYNGKEGDVTMLLWPAAYTLRYLGFDVAVPEILHGVHGYHRDARLTALQDRLSQAIANQPTLIAGLPDRPLIAFNADTDFDADGRLRPDAQSHSHFIRHRP